MIVINEAVETEVTGEQDDIEVLEVVPEPAVKAEEPPPDFEGVAKLETNEEGLRISSGHQQLLVFKLGVNGNLQKSFKLTTMFSTVSKLSIST